MTTRTAIVLQAARRLGDESADFLTLVDSFFNDVLRDLSASECLPSLRKTATFDIVEDQALYSTRTITGLVSPDTPIRIDRIFVPTYGTEAQLDYYSSDKQFEAFKFGVDVTYRQVPRIWRYWPNRGQIELFPTPGADQAGTDTGNVVYYAPTTKISGATDIEEIHDEDIETIVFGLLARGASFRDETLLEIDNAQALYERGKRRMWGRAWNDRGGRADPVEF